jgi:hypothetical protein
LLRLPDLVRVHLDPPVLNQETEEIPRRNAKDTFLGVKLRAGRMQFVEDMS